jgi:hypothetical protein
MKGAGRVPVHAPFVVACWAAAAFQSDTPYD